MKITIKGCKGCNIRNINTMGDEDERIIGGKTPFAEFKKIDERKSVNIHGIDKVKVDSNLSDVTVSVGRSDDIEVHYHGEVDSDGKLDWSCTRCNGEVNIVAKTDANIFGGNLKLDLSVLRYYSAGQIFYRPSFTFWGLK